MAECERVGCGNNVLLGRGKVFFQWKGDFCHYPHICEGTGQVKGSRILTLFSSLMLPHGFCSFGFAAGSTNVGGPVRNYKSIRIWMILTQSRCFVASSSVNGEFLFDRD